MLSSSPIPGLSAKAMCPSLTIEPEPKQLVVGVCVLGCLVAAPLAEFVQFQAVPRNAHLRSPPLVEQAPCLWIWPGDPARADPALIPDLARAGLIGDWHVELEPPIRVAARAALLLDNLFDQSHIALVHPTSLGGTTLPELKLYGDPTFIISTALATRDFQDVHHDRDKAQGKGSKDIFVNILTDTGLVQRYVTDWAGPSALIKSIGLRLGVPWYAYDTVTFSGEVTAVDAGLITVKVVGSNSLGDHVIATTKLTIGDV